MLLATELSVLKLQAGQDPQGTSWERPASPLLQNQVIKIQLRVQQAVGLQSGFSGLFHLSWGSQPQPETFGVHSGSDPIVG